MAKKSTKAAASAVTEDMVLPPEVENGTGETGNDEATKLAELTSPHVAKMGETELTALRTRIKDLRTQIEDGYWELAQDLNKVWNDTLYIEFGFESWSDYVEKELDFKVRTAQYMISIAGYFGKMSPDVQAWVKSLGWTKAKELVGKVDEESLPAWKKKTAGKSVSQIIDMLKVEKGAKSATSATPDEFKRRGFKLALPQLENVEAAVAKAKDDAKTDSEAHALDLICTEYLATHQGTEGLNDYLARIEKIFGVSLIAYNKNDDQVVFGKELLEGLPAAS